ncbi:ATP-binding cassette domain-containing protein [Melioribacteraceae bacterium 4301-Me]|uniref:ABC transporter ATP-binding protein n=1 Tax=Pyranulibacter aquaticus TaxID=3163344 RepID=UPI0035995150
MESIVEINNLKKSFGEIDAVDNISLEVSKGELFGLVGPDGAGKTTTIRILCGLLNYDSGSAKVFGKEISTNRKEIQNQIGYLSQKFSLYGDLTIDENIEFFAKIHGVKKYEQRRNELLEFTRLLPFRDRLAEHLSGGMKQKLALACSLIHYPKILFLDEPTTGVDPISRRDFWKILANMLKEKITVFMTTSYMDEAERCNNIALMNKGKIISTGAPEEVKASINKSIVELVCSDVRTAYSIIKKNSTLEVQLFGDRINVMFNNYADEYKIIDELLRNNKIEVLSRKLVPPSLENVFFHLITQ